ncbi:MAG: diguanylate phosphodiesterase [Alteromonadaceae bacterium]|uniref:EAL domain-containing protein n=2 Tax=Hydrocarboniclastica marina TaxID=2259620 RepID=A0A4P7XMS4_9ALTE|nr:diguanylate phosphodiesterase [Alteromonadaceae bacterium]QCF27922.1 EAL domain-containing protein [Hydrocarboniclastica marina]|tara:strand:+ start:550 stop:1794 length:1245 start_codon:yes stop_codon:yes gene_type:complete
MAEFESMGSLLRAPQAAEGWAADYHGLKLRTALQPIFSISHKRTIGYEALIRAFDNDNVSVLPGHLFGLPHSEAENVLLDRLCRYLHVQNFSCLSDDINWLFINVSPKAVASGHHSDYFFGQLLKRTGFPPHRIVVEIVEQPTDDSARLRDAVDYYKKLGCLTAIDDFGAGHSNFERIWNLRPDIVKLDRQMLVRATDDKSTRQILKGIVSLLHQSGCLVLLEGVETREQALIAVDAGVDFVQGFYFQVPSLSLDKVVSSAADFEGLLNDYKLQSKHEADPSVGIAGFFEPLFRTATNWLSQGHPARFSCDALLQHHAVSRCYLIGSDGVQIGDTILSAKLASNLDPRFRPLENASSADWFRQHYLQRALSEPGALQITRPYLSVSGAHMCVTLSCSYTDSEGAKVLCCDIFSN